MPKIKSGASGRHRERQEQRRELKSAGGGDSWEGVGRVGSSGGTQARAADRDLGRAWEAGRGPRSPSAQVPGSRLAGFGPGAPPLASSQGGGLDVHSASRAPSVTLGGSRWLRNLPPGLLLSSLRRSNI